MKLSVFYTLFLSLLLAACSTTQSDKLLFYRVKVQRGESLAQIAARFDTTWEAIARDNDLGAGSKIYVGMNLKVRPGPGGYLAGTEAMSRDVEDIPNGTRRKGLLFNNNQSSVLSWPHKGKITSGFGTRHGRRHDGIDIDGVTGDKVHAAAGGKVILAQRTNGYGRTVIVSHGNHSTLYAHLSSIDVDEGDSVERGDVLGEVGNSGHSRGSHLHFEVRNAANKPVDPMAYLEERRSLISSR